MRACKEDLMNGMIEVADLCKEYGRGENVVHALSHVSFTIQPGEMIAVGGASGAGKSTLMNLMGGIDVPSSGKVLINGRDIYGMNDRDRTDFLRTNIGIIYQFFNLIPILNVRENILLPLLLDGQGESPFADELIDKLGLSTRSGHLPSQLSGGQQQRAAIARALVTRPKLILADEPTGNLDKSSSKEVIRILRQACEEYKQTILIVTHDPEVAAVCPRALHIEDGQLVERV